MEAPGMSNITQSGIETQSDPLVTVSGEFSECPRMHAICVRHSHLPELYGEGETTREAAEDLLRQLLFESGYVDTNWQQEVLDRAIAGPPACVVRPDRGPPHRSADVLPKAGEKDAIVAHLLLGKPD